MQSLQYMACSLSSLTITVSNIYCSILCFYEKTHLHTPLLRSFLSSPHSPARFLLSFLRSKKYKTSLYIINGFIAFIALGLLCLGAWAYYADAGLVIREAYPSLIIFLIACSAIAFLVASAGISGAYNAVKRIRQEGV